MAKKKSKKHNALAYFDWRSTDRVGPIDFVKKAPPKQEGHSAKTPHDLQLAAGSESGVFFGQMATGSSMDSYIGMPQGTDGNIAIIGGNGSGKSAGIAKPTLRTWTGAICATDIKGELSDYYATLAQHGVVTRPYLIFDPSQEAGPSYDPFWWLSQDDPSNLINNILEIVAAIIPISPNDNQLFWVQTERSVFAAALLYFYEHGLSFSEAVCKITSSALSSLFKEILQENDCRTKIILGDTDMKPELLASVDRGLRNKLIPFAIDVHLGHVFRGAREHANFFTWKDLESSNIFLRIPADRIEQWSGAINLMYSQLIRYFERRPERHSPQGKNNVQTLLLMDEFARFGKLEMITDAMSTLRSRGVNICLMVQSIAQLDKIYGEYDRRIILDNCQYQAILRVDDPDSQNLISRRIGTCIHRQHSLSSQLDCSMKNIGFGRQTSEVRDFTIAPHQLSSLTDVLLLTPQGFHQIKKCFPTIRSWTDQTGQEMHSDPEGNATLTENTASLRASGMNPGATMLTVEERLQQADHRLSEFRQQQRQEKARLKKEEQEKEVRRNCIIGKMVCSYFPQLNTYEAGTKKENLLRFQPVENFLAALANDSDLVEIIKERALHRPAQESTTLMKDEEAKGDKRRYRVIGELVCRHFPEIQSYSPGTSLENLLRFQSVESFIAVLANDTKVVEQIRKRASRRNIQTD